jgi:hypothetical protein
MIKWFRDFVDFKILISPTLLRILYWPATLATIYYSGLLIWNGFPIGWVALIMGVLFVRVFFEVITTGFHMARHLRILADAEEEEED